MKALYRTNFEVRGQLSAKELPDALAKICWQWVFDPKRGYVAPTPMPATCLSFLQMPLSAGAHVEAILSQDGNAIRWALGFSHPDRTEPSVLWRTELGIERTSKHQVYFSCSLYVGRTNKSLAPLRRAATRPRIVLEILKQFKGHGALPLTSTPLLLKPEKSYVQAFLALLRDTRRQHPVVFVSTHEQSERFFFDVSRLADHLAGTAYVVVSENRRSCQMLEQQMPVHLQAFDGAVRLYWPGFTFRSNSFDHPLWTKFRIVTIQTRGRDAFSKRLLGDIAAVSATSIPDSLLTWAKIEEAHRRHAIVQAKIARDNEELLKLYEQENADLQFRNKNLEQELRGKGEELYRAQARIAMLDNAPQLGEADKQLPPVDSVADAIEQAGSRWAGQLVFAPNSKSEGDESPFQPAYEVLQAFEWLATIYYPAKLGKLRVTNLMINIRERIPGWTYAAHQSEVAVTRFREWYRCQWEGCVYSIAEHIGTGSSPRPEETIRIAFAWDKPKRKIVIGFVGQHQKNTKS